MSRLDIDARTWAELSRLLDAALDRPAEARQEWLDSLPAEFDGLKPYLRELLSRSTRLEAGGFLATLPKLGTLPDADEGGDAHGRSPGDVIGPYRLVRELGRGGMGSVWLAERIDGLVQRPLALKLPLGVRRAALVERMAREREILGTLDHPNIAGLLDAGLTADGQPFLALEYVEGRPIDEVCSLAVGGTAPPVRERLRLFLQVAHAVAYAHGKLVLHRDLKPANVLVGTDGQVRLLDFGIAKILEEGRTAETRLTEVAGRALTVDYASPEQIRGEPLTVASDVYSLGVILYELLSGARPYRPKRRSRAALEEVILQADPLKPSDLASPKARRALRGDLDTIVLKALKKTPSDRYATVNALAEDLQRHLDGRPVLARPDRAWYRVRKFVGRHRLAVGTSTAVLLALLGGAGVASWQGTMAAAAGRRAEQVTRFIASIFQNADPHRGPGHGFSASELLRQARARLDATRIEDPTLRLELLNTLGESMLGLDDAEAAVPVLRDALEVATSNGIDSPQSWRARRLHASGIARSGRSAEALDELEGLLQWVRRAPREDPAELVATLVEKAKVENQSGRYQEAERTAREALSIVRAELGGNRPEAVSALIELSYANDYLRRSQRSFEAARDAFLLAKEVFAADEAHPAVNAARMQYAITHVDQDRIDEALDLMRASLHDAARLFGADSRIVARYSASMVQYLVAGGRIEEALERSASAVRILEPLLEPDSPLYASLLDGQGLALLAARRAAEALEVTSRARDIVRQQLGEEHESVFVLTLHRGRELALLGRLDEARRELQWVVDHYAKAGRSTLSMPLHQLGFVARLQGRAAEAVSLQERALALVRPGPRARRSSARILVELGLAHLAGRNRSGAREALEEARSIYEEKFATKPPEYGDAMVGLGRIALLDGAPAEAIPFFEIAASYWRELDAKSPWARESTLWLERARASLGSPSAARD